jgi:glycosyltransferase involved in cell wall biosynthesis
MKVDIIIPAYNPGSYIIDAIESCLGQSYKKYEIFIVDDCSTQSLDYLKKKFPKINLLKTPKNSGPAAARNLGIKNSSGDLISFLDADDIMMRDKLYFSIKKFSENPNIGMTCGNYQILVNRNKIKNPFYKKSLNINWKTLMVNNYVASGSVTVKRNILDDIGLFNEKYWIGEDYDLWLRISEKYEIGYIHQILYCYSKIIGGNSLTDRTDIQKQHLKNLEMIKKESKERVGIDGK